MVIKMVKAFHARVLGKREQREIKSRIREAKGISRCQQ